jgi:hypothetical protein
VLMMRFNITNVYFGQQSDKKRFQMKTLPQSVVARKLPQC